MTELELLQRARMYMDHLARGYNPLDGSEIPEGEVVNQVRISRCLFYVTEVLDQVISQRSPEPQKKKEKSQRKSFFLTDAQKAAFPFSQEPVTISALIQKLNGLTDPEAVTPIHHRQISDWLVDAGFLTTIVTQEGRHFRLAAPQGAAVGIVNAERIGKDGTYQVVTYREEAQHFLLDHLDAILAFSAHRLRKEGSPWSKEENVLLRSLFNSGADVEEIASQLGRKTTSVKHQLKKIGP